MTARRISIAIVTHSPSPYQVELFNELARVGRRIVAIYLWESDRSRSWSASKREHDFISLNGDRSKLAEARQAVGNSELSVFNFYTNPLANTLLEIRAASRKPWVFWGERPGFHLHPLFGKLLRRWKLRALHKSKAPIWGIGRWAVEQYRDEFGNDRHYADIPYFSNLQRFEFERRRQTEKTVFLFSGAINKRKGVDLLAKAFVDLAHSHPNVELVVLGEGEFLPQMKTMLRSCLEKVRFLGFKDWDDLPTVYREADFLCVPSRYDGWALVVPEGLASGLPIIGTDRTGAAIEFVKTNDNGWLIPGNDEAALLNAMRAAVALSEDEKAALADNARKTVVDHQLNDGVRKILAEADSAVANWS